MARVAPATATRRIIGHMPRGTPDELRRRRFRERLGLHTGEQKIMLPERSGSSGTVKMLRAAVAILIVAAASATPAAPPPPPCLSWCASNTRSWEIKCGWSSSCGSCAECFVSPPPGAPAPALPPPLPPLPPLGPGEYQRT
eukprot:6416567-Prymnesium_polylepis.1